MLFKTVKSMKAAAAQTFDWNSGCGYGQECAVKPLRCPITLLVNFVVQWLRHGCLVTFATLTVRVDMWDCPGTLYDGKTPSTTLRWGNASVVFCGILVQMIAI
jgi:hypothetical protein